MDAAVVSSDVVLLMDVAVAGVDGARVPVVGALLRAVGVIAHSAVSGMEAFCQVLRHRGVGRHWQLEMMGA